MSRNYTMRLEEKRVVGVVLQGPSRDPVRGVGDRYTSHALNVYGRERQRETEREGGRETDRQADIH